MQTTHTHSSNSPMIFLGSLALYGNPVLYPSPLPTRSPPPVQTGTFGATAGVADLQYSSHDDPELPYDWWKQCSASGPCAHTTDGTCWIICVRWMCGAGRAACGYGNFESVLAIFCVRDTSIVQCSDISDSGKNTRACEGMEFPGKWGNLSVHGESRHERIL